MASEFETTGLAQNLMDLELTGRRSSAQSCLRSRRPRRRRDLRLAAGFERGRNSTGPLPNFICRRVVVKAKPRPLK